MFQGARRKTTGRWIDRIPPRRVQVPPEGGFWGKLRRYLDFLGSVWRVASFLGGRQGEAQPGSHEGPLEPLSSSISGRAVSFNFNKLRAMVAARVLVGIQLDRGRGGCGG